MRYSHSRTTSGTTFYCFSPPVMIATMTIEVLLALYALWRYKMTEISRLIVISLIMLATFQLAEYFVCTGGYGLRSEQWSRLGFVAITTLPVLGLHMMYRLAGRNGRRTIAAAYASMVGFIGFFLVYSAAFVGHRCTGNYVIFQIGHQMGGPYAVYYYGWLIVGIILGSRWANHLRSQGKSARRQLEAVRGLIIGYLVFLVPTTSANTVSPASRRAIPSIMCGFAIIFAVIMAYYILPRAGQIRRATPPSKT